MECLNIGSYNTYKGNIGINGSYNLLNYSLCYSALNCGGFSASDKKYGNNEKDSYRNNSFYSQVGLTRVENINFDFIFNFSKSRAGLDQNEKYGDDPICLLIKSCFKRRKGRRRCIAFLPVG